MRQFLVRYDDKLIGVLYINEEGEYRYICNKDMIDEIPQEEHVPPALSTNQFKFGDIIPYFKVRVDFVSARMGKDGYGFLTDKVRLFEVL